MAALGRLASRRRRWVTAAALLVAVAALWWGHAVAGRLSTGGWAWKEASSSRAEVLLTQRFHGGVPDMVLMARTPGSVDAPEARDAGRRLVNLVRADRKVIGVDSYWTGPWAGMPRGGAKPRGTPAGGDERLGSADRHSALVLGCGCPETGGTRP
ncbi:hypothetical protein AC230_19470 [Streptomyces caatingaensis]|uniref:Uncharacterized protein n=1 Tax=Streptomyces caatingaensis TaxID=1678637 RepID=A0A0K9XE68_9ACTN|nr:hypothetical protein AC230_19470 [Streptomyces caatingaensis]